MNEIQSSASRQVSFGPFRLLPYQRLLLQGDQQVFLGSRALDILTALVERPGELVTRAELMSRAWPDTVVVPANLTVHVAALRGALGDGKEGQRYVVTVPGRGYRLVTPVAVTDVRMAAAAYAVAKLREANERELQRRHAKHYRVMLETAVPEGTSPVPTSLLSEIDNVRMTLRWAWRSRCRQGHRARVHPSVEPSVGAEAVSRLDNRDTFG